jgi:hypothetical protein
MLFLRWEEKSTFVERHVLRGYLVTVEDISKSYNMEDAVHNIQMSSESWDEFC